MSSTNSESSGENTAFINYKAAEALQGTLKSCFGPKGQYKMLVSGSGEIKLSKDGKTLLSEMSIIHPSATIIAKGALGQIAKCGDGTLTLVILVTELIKLSYRYLSNGIHPNTIVSELSLIFQSAIEELDKIKLRWDNGKDDLMKFINTFFQTKLSSELSLHFSSVLFQAYSSLAKESRFDFNMIEFIKIPEGQLIDSFFFDGLVLDHGSRHPRSPKRLSNCYILNLNVSLEYEKTEINSGFYYSNSEERKMLVDSEKKFIEERVQLIIEFKKKLGKDANLLVINQKGIDPNSLETFSQNGIPALRRAKRRNMERLEKICGGKGLNSLENLRIEDMGYSEEFFEISIGEEKISFIKGSEKSSGGTIVLKGALKPEVDMAHECIKRSFETLASFLPNPFFVPGGFFVPNYLIETISKSQKFSKMSISIFTDSFSSFLSNSFQVPDDLSSYPLLDSFLVWKNIILGSCVIFNTMIKIDEIINAGKQINSLKKT
jgi:T-complex protein 1 subunit zeta